MTTKSKHFQKICYQQNSKKYSKQKENYPNRKHDNAGRNYNTEKEKLYEQI